MAKTVPTLFTRYELSEMEERVAHILTQENLYAISNLIAEAAEEKIRLKFDTLNPQAFIQREAELQGNINILTHLITLHEEALREIKSQTPANKQGN